GRRECGQARAARLDDRERAAGEKGPDARPLETFTSTLCRGCDSKRWWLLLALENGVALLGEGGDGLSGVLGAEVERLRPPLVLQRLLHGHVEAVVQHRLREREADEGPG